MLEKTNGAQALLTELYQAGSPFLNQYPWEFERDRWEELLICSLMVGIGIETAIARDVVETLARLGMTAVKDLASAGQDKQDFISRIFIQQGCDSGKAREASKLLTSVAQAVERTWSGYLQRLLRSHGEKMVAELSSALKTAGLNDQAAAKTAVLWLQEVANIPILLPGDRYVQDFCNTHGLSVQQLLDTADQQGLNISVLDDLLALEAVAAEEEAPVPKIKKASAKAGRR